MFYCASVVPRDTAAAAAKLKTMCWAFLSPACVYMYTHVQNFGGHRLISALQSIRNSFQKSLAGCSKNTTSAQNWGAENVGWLWRLLPLNDSPNVILKNEYQVGHMQPLLRKVKAPEISFLISAR